MITFTVITCTYNAADVCERTFKSVAQQTYENVEHLILDGCSKDDTVLKAEAYAMANMDSKHKIVVVSEPDRGLYDAMNKGIRKANGDFLIFLNAGDVFHSADTLDNIVNAIADGEELPGVLYGETNVVDNGGNFIRHRRLKVPKRLNWRSFKYGMLVCHQAFYARVDIAKRNLYNLDYRYSADVDWCIRVMKDAERQRLKLMNVDDVLVDYLDGGMSIKNHRASLKERFNVMRSHYGLVTTVLMHGYFVLRSFLKH